MSEERAFVDYLLENKVRVMKNMYQDIFYEMHFL